VRKTLLDSSTYFDLQRAPYHWRKSWAQATMSHARDYLCEHERFSLAWASMFEVVDGYYRIDDMAGLSQFRSVIVPAWEILYADQETLEIAAAIHATLELMQTRIGLNDTYIAATAIKNNRVLVTSNTALLDRIPAAGFPLEMVNWRQR
jgi:tRNA(fMet)-specific endonuclease VapC